MRFVCINIREMHVFKTIVYHFLRICKTWKQNNGKGACIMQEQNRAQNDKICFLTNQSKIKAMLIITI